MAGYRTATSLARQLGDNQTAEILQQTLNEEGLTKADFNRGQVNVAATPEHN